MLNAKPIFSSLRNRRSLLASCTGYPVLLLPATLSSGAPALRHPRHAVPPAHACSAARCSARCRCPAAAAAAAAGLPSCRVSCSARFPGFGMLRQPSSSPESHSLAYQPGALAWHARVATSAHQLSPAALPLLSSHAFRSATVLFCKLLEQSASSSVRSARQRTPLQPIREPARPPPIQRRPPPPHEVAQAPGRLSLVDVRDDPARRDTIKTRSASQLLAEPCYCSSLLTSTGRSPCTWPSPCRT